LFGLYKYIQFLRRFYDGYFFGRFIDFTYLSESGFGFDLSPLSCSWSIKDSSDLLLSFVNATIYYNLIKQESFILGPFVTIHMLEKSQLDYFELQSGLRFSISQFDENSILCFNYFNIEFGYSYTNGTSGFFAQVGIDAIGVIYLLGAGAKKEGDEYKEQFNE